MWNYSYIYPTSIILVIFIIYYFVKPRLQIKMNRLFLLLLITDVILMITDVASSGADATHEFFSIGILYFLNTTYFVFYLLRIFCFFAYTASILDLPFAERRSGMATLAGVFVISEFITLSSLFTGAVFYIDLEGYHSGPLYNILYVTFVFYILLALVLIIGNRRKLPKEHFICLIVYNLVLLAGNVIRFFFPNYLIMNTFCLIAIILIYLTFQNPDFYMSEAAGVFNTRALEASLNEIHHRSNVNYCILGLLIRNFTELREVYSRAQIDECIVQIGSYLKETFKYQTVFYCNDGRFVLLDTADVKGDVTRNKIRERFMLPWQTENGQFYIESDFVLLYPNALVNTTEDILNGLQDAFNKLASESTNLVLSPEGLVKYREKADIKRALEIAIEQDSVEVFLQPLMDAKSGKIIGAEALARIRDSSGGLIPPGLFIPIAERNGRINAMGEQVFEKVCKFIQANDMEKLGLSWINVNVSPIQCMDRNLERKFLNILAKYGVPAELTHLEITEESMIDYVLLQKQIMSMQNQGFKFVLDDYGSGYSNVARLKHVPFINVKLDMEIVWDYFHEPDKILPTLVQTFKEMHFTVTAEGIENKEMADAMTEIGCDYLQGYYFSKPLPMDEFVNKYS